MGLSNKIVAYYYDQEVGNYNDVNLMRPHRVRLAHNLIDSYGLQDKMLVHRPVRTPVSEMEQFHADGETCAQTPQPYVITQVVLLQNGIKHRYLLRECHNSASPGRDCGDQDVLVAAMHIQVACHDFNQRVLPLLIPASNIERSALQIMWSSSRK